MNKLDMESKKIIDENVAKVGNIFPNAVVETEKGFEIDFNVLKQELSNVIVDDTKEKYQLTWPGKKNSILNANTPSKNTLRPVKEKSVEFDNTENIYIEGDNLEALKILQESYLNKIKCIYIDPPYNTGNDFIYNDNFKKDSNDELEESGQIDNSGNKLVSNSTSNGKYHSDWLTMMYPRLKLARNLLTEDGVIFISIDDNEVDNIKKICNAIFGENCFIAQMVRKRRDSQANLSQNISPIHEYLLAYSRNGGEVFNKIPANINESDYKNPDNDYRGPYVTMPCTNKGGAVYSVTTPSGKEITEEWRFKKETYDTLLAENKLVFPRGGDGKPRYKLFLSEKQASGVLANTWLDYLDSNQVATRELKQLFGDFVMFDMPKPISLIIFCMKLGMDKNSIILDFFSGSSTTAHAVMQLNAEDAGSRKYIMVQLPEKTEEKSEAYKAGYQTICDIGEERIRKAAKKIKEETNANIDYGFRVYKIDSSNMKDVYYKPNELKQENLQLFETNIKEDRNHEDLLMQIILDLGLTLDLKIEEKVILNNRVYFVDNNSLVACFDDVINLDIVNEICRIEPLKMVFKDSSFQSDNDKINLEERVRKLSPETEINIL